MSFLLVMMMTVTVGIGAPYKYEIEGTRPYASLEACQKAGRETANWLAQDFLVVEWRCVEQGEGG